VVLRVLRGTGLYSTIVLNRYCGVCVNMVFSVTVRGTVRIMWTGTERFLKGQDFAVQLWGIYRVLCVGVIWCLVLQCGEE
jgi:hypothetical protein